MVETDTPSIQFTEEMEASTQSAGDRYITPEPENSDVTPPYEPPELVNNIIETYKQTMANHGIEDPEISIYEFLEYMNDYIKENDPKKPLTITAHLIAAIPMRHYLEEFGPAITKDNTDIQQLMDKYDELSDEASAYVQFLKQIKPKLIQDAEEFGCNDLIKTIDTPYLEIMERLNIITPEAQKYINNLVKSIHPTGTETSTNEAIFNYLENTELPTEYTINPITIKDTIDSHPTITTETLAKA